MKDWFDRERIWCISCKHKWTLTSNKQITREQHNIWVEKVLERHNKIKHKKGSNQ